MITKQKHRCSRFGVFACSEIPRNPIVFRRGSSFTVLSLAYKTSLSALLNNGPSEDDDEGKLEDTKPLCFDGSYLLSNGASKVDV